jgi:hypothetical protein
MATVANSVCPNDPEIWKEDINAVFRLHVSDVTQRFHSSKKQ